MAGCCLGQASNLQKGVVNFSNDHNNYNLELDFSMAISALELDDLAKKIRRISTSSSSSAFFLGNSKVFLMPQSPIYYENDAKDIVTSHLNILHSVSNYASNILWALIDVRSNFTSPDKFGSIVQQLEGCGINLEAIDLFLKHLPVLSAYFDSLKGLETVRYEQDNLREILRRMLDPGYVNKLRRFFLLGAAGWLSMKIDSELDLGNTIVVQNSTVQPAVEGLADFNGFCTTNPLSIITLVTGRDGNIISSNAVPLPKK
jgi:hypothetical protein